jgi:hypothetical protein
MGEYKNLANDEITEISAKFYSEREIKAQRQDWQNMKLNFAKYQRG